MNLSIFAENATIEQDVSLRLGQIYRQDEFNSTDENGRANSIASDAREKGIVAGKEVSTILLNSILHEISGILCGVFSTSINEMFDDANTLLDSFSRFVMQDDTNIELFNKLTEIRNDTKDLEDISNIDTTERENITKLTKILIGYLMLWRFVPNDADRQTTVVKVQKAIHAQNGIKPDGYDIQSLLVYIRTMINNLKELDRRLTGGGFRIDTEFDKWYK